MKRQESAPCDLQVQSNCNAAHGCITVPVAGRQQVLPAAQTVNVRSACQPGRLRCIPNPCAAMKPNRIPPLLALLALLSSAGRGSAQGTAFTHQGRLTDGANVANGNFDFRSAVFDSSGGATQIGSTLTNSAVPVGNGLFTLTLDFGTNVFDGSPRWLEIALRTNGGGAFTALSPRQPITPAPYAVFAARAGRANTAAFADTADSVSWTSVKNLPAGFADGVDNDTTYSAGLGLTLTPANTFQVNFGTNGAATTAARSDHDHFGQAWSGDATRGLSLATTASAGSGVAGLLGRQGTGSGFSLITPSGVWGDTSDGSGVLGTTAAIGGDGVRGWQFAPNGSGSGVYGLTASVNGKGVRGAAYAVTGTNYGVYGQSSSPDGFGVCAANTAGGVDLKADGSGVVQSVASSFFFAPGAALQRGSSSSALQVSYYAYGAQVKSGGFVGDATCVLPLTVPAVFYGQNVTVKRFTVFYKCENGANNYLTGTTLSKMTDADTSFSLIGDTANRTSNTASSYSLTPLAGQELNSSAGALTLTLTFHFANAADFIQIGGVRVELGHD